ncbi:MAG: class I SAM-dependent methyltransferase [Bacteroidota bacterium]
MPDFSDFLEVQTRTPWGRTLSDFAFFCAPSTGSVALDVGCGPGLLPALLAGQGCRTVGVDLDLALLSAGLTAGLAQADAGCLPFPAGTFDLITATNVLFLLDDPAAILMEWLRVAGRTGTLCLLNPSQLLSVEAATALADQRGLEGAARRSLLGWARNAQAHARWTEGETRALLQASGWTLSESVLKVGPGFARFARAHPQRT